MSSMNSKIKALITVIGLAASLITIYEFAYFQPPSTPTKTQEPALTQPTTITSTIIATTTQSSTAPSPTDYDRTFNWNSGQHIMQQNDFAVSPDFVIETSYQQFAVARVEVTCSMRNIASAGAAVWDIGAIVGGQPATWSKPPPPDPQKDTMNYRGVAFGQVNPGWSGQPFFQLDYVSRMRNAGGAPVYNENWMRFYGNVFRSTDGRVHVMVVVWTGLGQTDLVVDSCSVHVIITANPTIIVEIGTKIVAERPRFSYHGTPHMFSAASSDTRLSSHL
jgi:hypothetical protein